MENEKISQMIKKIENEYDEISKGIDIKSFSKKADKYEQNKIISIIDYLLNVFAICEVLDDCKAKILKDKIDNKVGQIIGNLANIDLNNIEIENKIKLLNIIRNTNNLESKIDEIEEYHLIALEFISKYRNDIFKKMDDLSNEREVNKILEYFLDPLELAGAKKDKITDFMIAIIYEHFNEFKINARDKYKSLSDNIEKVHRKMMNITQKELGEREKKRYSVLVCIF